MKITTYGKKLRDNFVNKTTMREDIEQGTFLGTIFYEKHIETIQDAVGWMLETYDTDALDILDEWIENDNCTQIWGMNINRIKEEFKKVIK